MNLHKKYCPYCGMVHFCFFEKEDIGRQCVCSCCLCSKRFVVKVKKLAERDTKCDTKKPIIQARINGKKIAYEVDLESFLRSLRNARN